MLNPNDQGPKEASSPLIFVPLLLIGVYITYLMIAIPFDYGFTKGQNQNPSRPPPEKKGAVEEKVFDQRVLYKATSELIATGAAIYAANCASCHGSEGLGNGASGLKLAVKPRNLHDQVASGWKNGPSILQMYETLDKGLGSMPAFPGLDPEKRYAVIHYIHAEYTKKWPADDPKAVAALPGPAAGAAVKIDPYKETRVPVQFAAEKIAVPLAPITARLVANVPQGLGKKIYDANCAACHGPAGEGNRPSQFRTLAQLRQLAQGTSLLNQKATWANNYGQFAGIVTRGVPGTVKPGIGTLSEAELRAVYQYTLALRQ